MAEDMDNNKRCILAGRSAGRTVLQAAIMADATLGPLP